MWRGKRWTFQKFVLIRGREKGGVALEGSLVREFGVGTWFESDSYINL